MSLPVLRVVFMGTPDFSVQALQALIDGPHKVVCVYTQPPRPKGRGQHLQKSPVHQCAEDAGIEVRCPLSLKKDKQAQQDFIDLGADVAVVAAYGLILPKDVLDAPKYGCLNIHASLLPHWRGASPIQRSIWAGDTQTGVTIMQMEEGLDTGPMIAKRTTPIGADTTTPILHDVLATLGADMIVATLDQLARDKTLPAEKQDDALMSYAGLLTKNDGRVNWAQTASEIDRQIRALNPWPGVSTMSAKNLRIKIASAAPSEQTSNLAAGSLIDKHGHVACGGGSVLRLVTVQPDNARPMDMAAAINGGYFSVGDRFQ